MGPSAPCHLLLQYVADRIPVALHLIIIIFPNNVVRTAAFSFVHAAAAFMCSWRLKRYEKLSIDRVNE